MFPRDSRLDYFSLILLFIIISSCNSPYTHVQDKTISSVKELNTLGIQNSISKSDIKKYLKETDDTLNILIHLLASKGNAIIIDQNDIIAGSPVFYTDLFSQLSKLDKKFVYNSFFTEMKEGEDFDYYFDKAAWVAFSVQGNSYESYLYYDEKYPVSNIYYNLANRALTDAKASNRFYGVNIFCNDCNSDLKIDGKNVDPSRFAVISLEKNDADYIKESKILSIQDNSHDILSTMQVNKFLKDLFQNKILTNITEDYKKQKIQEMKYTEFKRYEDILQFFDSTNCIITTEAFSETPYLDLLTCMQYISSNRFAPRNVVDSYQKDTTSHLTFTFLNKKNDIELQNLGNNIDISFLVKINEILQDQNVDGQFYFLNKFQNEGMLLFLNNNQYNYFINTYKIDIENIESVFSNETNL